MKIKVLTIYLVLSYFVIQDLYSWGFHAHKQINKIAVFTLPTEMLPFYKHHIQYITDHAVNPDKRRYAVEGEAPKHYIDIDVYGDSAVYTMPRYWKDAVAQYSEDTLMKYGIVPWHIEVLRIQLTKAFREKRLPSILKLSADIGHYIADANVPLHTTENYNGQLSGQEGIHGLWESRLPELFSHEYHLFTGSAKYIRNTQLRAWKAVTVAHQALDSVLSYEKSLSEKTSASKRFSYEERGKITVKTYARKYSDSFHRQLMGQVERQMKLSIKMVGDFWFTCWVDAGQPVLTDMLNRGISEEERKALEAELKIWEAGRLKSRQHEGQVY